MTNPGFTVIYTEVIHDLKKRVWEQKQKLGLGFTQKYSVVKLVYDEIREI